MPSLGADMESGTLLEWHVKPGDVVHRGDIVARVDTEKAEIEVEIFHDGVVEELLVTPGTKVPVGTPLARLRAAEGAVVAPAARPEAPAPPPRAVTAPPPAPPPPAAAAAPLALRRLRVSPVARRIAEERGIDLAGITGTGPDGAITRADVERAAAAPVTAAAPAAPAALVAPVTAPAAPAPPAPTLAPAAARAAERARAMRRTIGAAMARSKREIPHYYLATTIDLSRAMAWLAQQNERRPVTERLLPAALLLKATALAARAVPNVNGFWDGGFQPAPSVHLGVAISLRGGGLVAPAVHDAHERSVDELMAALRDLVERARAGRLRASEMADPTLTVTNLGDQGAEEVLGVIYPPQVAIVGFGKLVERPWAVEGMVGVRPTVRATLAADHRVTDGHEGSRFLSMIERSLNAPEAL